MPNYDALATLFQNPAVSAVANRKDRRTEMARNLELQKADPRHFGSGATSADLSELDSDISSDPDTGTAARDYTNKVIGTQQTGNIYDMPESRRLRADTEDSALKKLLMPIHATGENALAVEKQRGENDLAKQGLANEGLIGAANAKSSGTGLGGKPLPSGLMERVAAGSEGLSQLHDLRAMTPRVTTGPLMGRIQGWAQDMPGLPASKDFATFKSNSAALANSVIKAITGAQMSQAEVPRIMAQVPTEKDKPEVWSAKADTLEKITKGLNARISLLNQGIPAELLNTVSVDHLGEYASPQEAMQALLGGGDADADSDDLGADWGGR